MAVRVAVLGAGSFGSCLAILCADRGHDVTLWARDAGLVDSIARERRNPRFLKEIEFPATIRPTTDLDTALADREMVIVAVPSHAVRDVMTRAGSLLHGEALVVSAVKGIEMDTGKTMDEVIAESLPAAFAPRVVVISGPSFAKEVAQHMPTVVTVACREEAYAIAVQSHLSSPWFRCYSETDVLGVEIGGALKNVIAIAVGISDGLGLGLNARAATMTRGLAEITRLGVRMGANPLTFLGLAGMGDLVLTCTGDLSRNRRVGLALGQGRKLADILEELGEVAEGVRTTYAACQLAERLGVELPIAQGVKLLLEGAVDPRQGVTQLLTRQLRGERDWNYPAR
ncbi:MAG: NAD(P)-dependent glycerol-3-phosphate dehydrogenase [Myxococcota bacterium]|jgi:glycerol-3-phosphate dehydrogenase (NAD(P)+)|nr:NAD(P)-dependent glycerol-3-phosphate dehydrogenase [Myxococcota bacterium]